MAVTPTEGYKRPDFRGILRQDKDAKNEGQADQETDAQVDIAPHRPAHAGVKPRRKEAVPGRRKLQEGD